MATAPKAKQVAIIDDATGLVEMVMGVIPPKGQTVEEALQFPRPGKTLVYPTASQNPERGGKFKAGKFAAPEEYNMQEALGLPTADEPRPPEVEQAPQGERVELAAQNHDEITVAGASPIGDAAPLVPIDREMEAPDDLVPEGMLPPDVAEQITGLGPIVEKKSKKKGGADADAQ